MQKSEMVNTPLLNNDIFSIKGFKRGELVNIHSFLLYLYNKAKTESEVTIKYAEISWMSSNTVTNTLNKLIELGWVTLLDRPKKHLPVKLRLLNDSELRGALAKCKKIDIGHYMTGDLTVDRICSFLDCHSISIHFNIEQVPSWLRNISNGVWDRAKFLILIKIISNFDGNNNLKTASVNKYMKKQDLIKTSGLLFDMLPFQKQDILQIQFCNSLPKDIEKSYKFEEVISKYTTSLATLI